MKCDSQASFLACTFANPCLGHEPNARVATNALSWKKKMLKPIANKRNTLILNDVDVN
jgi:hypothetical protein